MTSEIFRFTVGPERREFSIHSALVARQSRALDTLVNGCFAEARNRHAVLESVEEEIFSLFTQYAYTGNYDPLTTAVWSETRSRETKKTVGQNMQYNYYHPPTWAGLRTRPNLVLENFRTAANRFNKDGFYQDLDGDGMKSQIDIFRRHAKMCIFADCYGISDLLELALNKLGERLITFKLSDETVGDILDLLRYCDDAAAPEELKSFVILYAASEAKTLWKSEDFQKYVLESRELTTALFNQVLTAPDSKNSIQDGDLDEDDYGSWW